MIDSLLLSLVRVALGNEDALPVSPSPEEWNELYSAACKQAVAGVCFSGVYFLYRPGASPDAEEWNRSHGSSGLSKELYYNWMLCASQIKDRNETLNDHCLELQDALDLSGTPYCIFKGQSLAPLYRSGRDQSESFEPLSFLRASGDIDVWVKCDRQEARKIAGSLGRIKSEGLIHLYVIRFEDAAVEIHDMPTYLRSPRYNWKFRKWASSFDFSTFKKNEYGIVSPSRSFNEVFILLHIFRHLLGEGIGLRQLMDYYFVLLDSDGGGDPMRELKSLGVDHFASGLMFIMKEAFGMKAEKLIAEPDEKLGSMILSRVMAYGDFGHGDSRKKGGETKFDRFIRANMDNLCLLRYFPSEILCTPMFRIVSHIKRIINSK